MSVLPNRSATTPAARVTTVQTVRYTQRTTIVVTQSVTLTRTTTPQQKSLFRHSVHQLQGSSRHLRSNWSTHWSTGCSTVSSMRSACCWHDCAMTHLPPHPRVQGRLEPPAGGVEAAARPGAIPHGTGVEASRLVRRQGAEPGEGPPA